jgi:acetyltransferase-like isoleucine patch superfamily enzyme
MESGRALSPGAVAPLRAVATPTARSARNGGATAGHESARWPPNLELGVGALIEDGVRLGSKADRRTRSKPIKIGRHAHIRSGTVIYSGVHIGDRLDVGNNVVVQEDAVIGDDCRVSSNSVISYGCTIGDRVRIEPNCVLAQFTSIGEDVVLGSGVCAGGDAHPGTERPLGARGPTIERKAQIGTNATLLPSVTIGEGALVWAGSVVTRNVPPGYVAVGNPARILDGMREASSAAGLEAPDGRPTRRRSRRGPRPAPQDDA